MEELLKYWRSVLVALLGRKEKVKGSIIIGTSGAQIMLPNQHITNEIIPPPTKIQAKKREENRAAAAAAAAQDAPDVAQ